MGDENKASGMADDGTDAPSARAGSTHRTAVADAWRLGRGHARAGLFRREAGFGLPVRRLDGGPAAGHLALVPGCGVAARYDFLTLAAIAIQLGLLALRLESLEEAKVILLFHVVGTLMELFKTAMGSWSYPEASLLRLGGVPLFSGFMYASIGSYIARAWRLFDFRFSRHPPFGATALLAAAIYLNFFTHHFLPDARPVLFAVLVLLFGRTLVHYRIRRVHRRMPLLLGFGLVALFIWLAENVGTYSKAWLYPAQRHAWSMVPVGKLGAWLLLMIISYVLVSAVHRQGRSGR